ncbi:hypothetical protein EVA_18765 [gut metagenome]|uniref:Uncharacterized protein n=1 Tax=gut metagenome TaxID=749906 RepID=J9FFC9_9ZZZZ
MFFSSSFSSTLTEMDRRPSLSSTSRSSLVTPVRYALTS